MPIFGRPCLFIVGDKSYFPFFIPNPDDQPEGLMQSGFVCHPNDRLPPYRFHCEIDQENQKQLTVNAFVPEPEDHRVVSLVNGKDFNSADRSDLFKNSNCTGQHKTRSLKIGKPGCFSECENDEGFRVNGTCDYCHGYCCREDGENSFCPTSVITEATFPTSNRHYCIEDVPTVVLGDSGCFSHCNGTEDFADDGRCDYCGGYCCRADGHDSNCTTAITDQVRVAIRSMNLFTHLILFCC